jgi:hypothetical protein
MKLSAFRNDILRLIFNATPIANVADNAATGPLTNLQVALHTAFPGLGGDQTNHEVAYTGYARAAVARSAGGWTVTGNSVSPVATIGFPQCTATANVLATHFSVGQAASGASKAFRVGVLGSRLGPFSAVVAGNSFRIPGLTGLAVNDRIVFHAVDGSALPGGVTEGQSYFVITQSGDDITVSTTQGGASITVSSAGDGIAYRSTPITINQGTTPQLTTATAIIEE